MNEVPQNVSKEDLIKYLNVLFGLLKKLRKDDEATFKGLEDKLFHMKQEVEDAFENIQLQKGDKGDKGDPGVDGIDGVDGRDGKDGKNGKDGRDGRDGKDAPLPDTTRIASEASKMAITEVLRQIPSIDDIEADLPKLGAAIRDGLELLQDDDRLKIEAIKDLREELDKLGKRINESMNRVSGGASGGHIVKAYDLSSQLDGVTKVFSLPSMWRIISVQTSSFPNALRPTVDFVYDASANTITFTSEITESSTLAAGQTVILIYSE